jgi:hypothetical protein
MRARGTPGLIRWSLIPRIDRAIVGGCLKRLRTCTYLGDRVNETRSLLEAMEAHAHGAVHWRTRRGSVAATKVIQVGALAAIVGGIVMAVWQMVVAAIAQQPTAVPGIHQTLWTPPEGIWSVVFGVHHFHGDFHFIPVFGGIAAHMMNSLILGLMGVVLLTAILGRQPHPAGR